MVILEDGLFEGDEEFVVVLSVPMGETGVEVRQEMATITIEDNDGNSSCMCSYHSKVHPFFQIQLLIKHVACVLQYPVYFVVGSLSLSLSLCSGQFWVPASQLHSFRGQRLSGNCGDQEWGE